MDFGRFRPSSGRFLKNALLATEAAIAKVISNKSWEPLGYDSFSVAWAAEMRDVTLATEIRPHVRGAR